MTDFSVYFIEKLNNFISTDNNVFTAFIHQIVVILICFILIIAVFALLEHLIYATPIASKILFCMLLLPSIVVIIMCTIVILVTFISFVAILLELISMIFYAIFNSILAITTLSLFIKL